MESVFNLILKYNKTNVRTCASVAEEIRTHHSNDSFFQFSQFSENVRHRKIIPGYNIVPKATPSTEDCTQNRGLPDALFLYKNERLS